ncbi:MAG: acyl-ACP desaturase [Myxococcaceae bacterium]|nr:acyl-ACP desaturase [Myxococcaceae bacterium]
MALSRALKDKFHREYMTFFEHAERSRRWNLFTDIDWAAVKNEPANEKLALCAETFMGVELYLPDYIDGHLSLFRDNFARAWFGANWGYEESKHAMTLWQYLVKSGHRTEEQMRDYSDRILSKKWQKPFDNGRQMTAYGCAQEMTTFVIYKKQQLLAEAEGNKTLAEAYKLIAKDEMAHAQYYMTIFQHYLDDDREGTLEDLSAVFYGFTMPAYDLVPDYEKRVEVMRTAGIDRGVFLTEVWGPVLKRFKLTRHDIPRPKRVREALARPSQEQRAE